MTGIEVGVAIIVGILIGRFLPNRRKGPQPVRPVCGCTHHHSFHDPATGECHATVQVPGPRKSYDDPPFQYQHVQCACKQYSGPQPLPEMFANEITSGD